jgi:sarcosine oxidase subunit gamma
VSSRSIVSEAAIVHAWNVQGDPSRSAFRDEVSRQLRVALPPLPNTTARGDRVTAFWLGPPSWLIVADVPGSPLTGFVDKRNALNAVGGALFDLSASRVAYRVVGPHATAILASGCPLDLHPRAFRAGGCAQSLFGRVNALLYKVDNAPTFVVMVARSFARDVRQALGAAARQFENGSESAKTAANAIVRT